MSWSAIDSPPVADVVEEPEAALSPSISLNNEESWSERPNDVLDDVLELSVDWLDSKLESVSAPNWPEGGDDGSGGGGKDIVAFCAEEVVSLLVKFDPPPCRFCTPVVEELPPEVFARRLACNCDHRLELDVVDSCIIYSLREAVSLKAG